MASLRSCSERTGNRQIDHGLVLEANESFAPLWLFRTALQKCYTCLTRLHCLANLRTYGRLSPLKCALHAELLAGFAQQCMVAQQCMEVLGITFYSAIHSRCVFNAASCVTPFPHACLIPTPVTIQPVRSFLCSGAKAGEQKLVHVVFCTVENGQVGIKSQSLYSRKAQAPSKQSRNARPPLPTCLHARLHLAILHCHPVRIDVLVCKAARTLAHAVQECTDALSMTDWAIFVTHQQRSEISDLVV